MHKRTSEPEVEFLVHPGKGPLAVVNLYPDDPEAIEPYPLVSLQAERIGAIIGRPIDGNANHYFLQAYDDADAIDRAQDQMTAQ